MWLQTSQKYKDDDETGILHSCIKLSEMRNDFQRQGITEVESKTVWDTVQGHYPQNIMIVFAEMTP